MRHVVRVLAGALLATLNLSGCRAQPGPSLPPLALEQRIALQNVNGRIDHLAVDPVRRRLFVAELGNGTVETVDLATGRTLGQIGGLKEPQGLGYLAECDELAVATGGDGMLRFYRTADLKLVGALKLGDDADNLHLDPARQRVVVGYGSGALAVIDPTTRSLVGVTPLPAHPEGFQLDGERAYVNLPDAGQIGVADLATGKLVSTWPNHGRRSNFPLAIDRSAGEVGVVYRQPAQLVIFDATTGAERQTAITCGDADDLFFDAKRRRLYVACGDGHVDVFERKGVSLERRAQIATSNGARTALFSPDLDRLFVAARAEGGSPAAILAYRPQ
jgi:DNA-binding beta-propeller fold protein YncE